MRARAADHHDHQEVDQVLERERRIQAQHVDGQRAAQPRQPRAERKRDAEQQADVDAHAGRRLLVVDRGAQLRAEPRPREQQTQRRRPSRPPARRGTAGRRRDRSRARVTCPCRNAGSSHRLLRRPPHPGRGRARHEREADREQHLIEVAAAIEAPVEQPLQRRAEQADGDEDDRQREQERHPERAAVSSMQRKPPIMANAPWARLTKFISPIVTDRPRLMRNSRLPYATPSKTMPTKAAHLDRSLRYDLPGSLTLASLSNSTLKYLPSTFWTLRT